MVDILRRLPMVQFIDATHPRNFHARNFPNIWISATFRLRLELNQIKLFSMSIGIQITKCVHHISGLN